MVLVGNVPDTGCCADAQASCPAVASGSVVSNLRGGGYLAPYLDKDKMSCKVSHEQARGKGSRG